MELLHSVFDRNQRLYDIALSTIAVASTSYEDFSYDSDFDADPAILIGENNVYNKEVPSLHIKLINKAMQDTEKALENDHSTSQIILNVKNSFELIAETISANSIIGSQLNSYLSVQHPEETNKPIIIWGQNSTDYIIDYEQLGKLDFNKCEKEIEEEWMKKTDSTSMFELRQKIEDDMIDKIQNLHIAAFVSQYTNAAKLYNLAQRVELKLDQKDLENQEKQTECNLDER
jgi:hypothetical protein